MFECTVDSGLTSLHDFAPDYHLIKDLINFVEIEYEVQLAHAPKVLVQNLNK